MDIILELLVYGAALAFYGFDRDPGPLRRAALGGLRGTAVVAAFWGAGYLAGWLPATSPGLGVLLGLPSLIVLIGEVELGLPWFGWTAWAFAAGLVGAVVWRALA